MTYPFAGVIKMEKSKDEDGNDKVVWKYDNPTQLLISPSCYPSDSILYGSGNTEWARIDKHLNLVHLDMDLCAKGPANAYTALAVGIWNAALEEAARYAAGEGDDTLADSILELKK